MSSLGEWWFNVKLLTRFTMRMQMTPPGQWFTILDNLIDILLFSVSRPGANVPTSWLRSLPQMLMCLNPWLLLRLAPSSSSNVVFGENEAMAGDWLWSLLVIRGTIERLRHQPWARVVSLGWGDGSGKSVHVIPVSWQLYYLKWNLTIVLLNTKHSLFSPADIQYFVLMFVQQHVVSG